MHSTSKHVSRRSILGGAIAGAGALAFGRAAHAQSTPVASPVPGAWPRTIPAANGDITIAAPPQRIVATSDWYEVDYLMAVGVEPILYGYTNRYGLGIAPWLSEVGGDKLESFPMPEEGPALELIAAKQPDLIIADPYFAETIADQLAAIATTVAIPTPYTGSNNWREGQIVVGQAVGKEAEAAEAIAVTEQLAAAGKAELASLAGRKVTIAYATEYNGGSLFFSEPGSQESTIVEDLGLTFFPLGPDNTPQSMELVGNLTEADILISYDNFNGPAILEANPLFQQLPAVKEGRYAVVSGLTGRALFAPTTLSVRYAITGLKEAILAAAAGNGRKVG